MHYFPTNNTKEENYKSDLHWAVFKWLSKVITWLRLLCLVIGLKDSRQFFNQWESKPKPKPIAPYTCDFSRALSEVQIIARNCDWFIALPAPVVIGRSNCFGFGFSTVNTVIIHYNNNNIVADITADRWSIYRRRKESPTQQQYRG